MNMRQIISELPIRRILLISIVLGSLVGGLTTQANRGAPTCSSAPSGCTIEGCHNSQPDGSGYTVCLYSGTSCPPLTQCSGN